MSLVLRIEQSHRYLISIGYRVCILFYSVFLLNFYQCQLRWFWTLLGLLIYFILFLLLFQKKGIFAFLRLVLDYSLIFSILLLIGAKLDNIYTFAYLILPILNFNNHSDFKKSVSLTVFSYAIPAFIFLVIQEEKRFIAGIPFLIFAIINSFDRLRTKYLIINAKLNSIIDDFFVDEASVKKPHKIYTRAIPLLNNLKYNTLKTEFIICFTLTGNKLHLVNGSIFVWNYRIVNENAFVESITSKPSKKNILFNIEIEIDNKLFFDNVVYVCRLEQSIYCYFFLPSNNSTHKVIETVPWFFDALIAPFFEKLSRVLESYVLQKKIELEQIGKMSEKINYINSTVSVMHFLRNKLSPIFIYLEMQDDIKAVNESVIRNELDQIIGAERNKIRTSLTLILDRANYILDKSNNPFTVKDTQFYGSQTLYVEIKTLVDYFINEQIITVNWEKNISANTPKLKYNTVGIDFVVSNWVRNMQKDNKGYLKVNLTEDENFYFVIFENSFQNFELIELVSQYNSQNRIEILKRSSHGIIEIKDFLEQMSLDSYMNIKENILYFTIKFKKYFIDENSNI